MNRSVNERQVTVASVENAAPTRVLSDWLTAVGLVAFPLVNFSLGMGRVWFIVSLTGAGLGYVLAVYLYRGVPGLVSRGRWLLLATAVVVGVTLAAVTVPQHARYMMFMTVATVVGTGAVVGWRTSVEGNSLRLYLYGAVVVAAGAVAIWAPQWPLLMDGVRQMGPKLVEEFKSMSGMTGLSADELALVETRTLTMTNFVSHLIPAGTVMTVVMQYSIGMVWFLSRDAAVSARPHLKLSPFTQWRVPFALTPVLVLFGLVRLVGGETGALIGDNVLAALSVYYCIGGLALVEHIWKKVGLATLLKVAFYILLTFTGLFGYLGMVLLGFLDSFFNWRKPRQDEIEAT